MTDPHLLRPCYKCLLRDLNKDAYFEKLQTYIDRLSEEERAEEVLYEERLHICTSCDDLVSGMCRNCGCFVELRAAMRKGRCPYDRW